MPAYKMYMYLASRQIRTCIQPPYIRCIRYSREMMKMKAIHKIRTKNNADGQKDVSTANKQPKPTGAKKMTRVASLLKTLNNSAPKVFSIATLKLL